MEPSSRIEANKVSVIEASKRVDNLCSVIQNTATDRSNSCIGILFDECNQPYRIWPTMTLSPYSPQPEAVSLESLLVHGALEKRDRLELGAQLASAVMQFHSTEWLNDCWGKQDIFFLQKAVHQRAVAGGVVLVHEPVIDKPFVRRTFGSSKELYPLRSNTLQNNTPTTLVEHDRSLFSLGIMLIELWFERRIEDLRTPSQNHDCDIQSQSSDNVNYQTARDCLGEIFIYAGEDYGVAVSRCINGFNIPIGNTQAISGSLDNDDFKNDVHTNVVCLLEKNLKVSSITIPKSSSFNVDKLC
jgi:hypothetical protein